VEGPAADRVAMEPEAGHLGLQAPHHRHGRVLVEVVDDQDLEGPGRHLAVDAPQCRLDVVALVVDRDHDRERGHVSQPTPPATQSTKRHRRQRKQGLRPAYESVIPTPMTTQITPKGSTAGAPNVPDRRGVPDHPTKSAPRHRDFVGTPAEGGAWPPLHPSCQIRPALISSRIQGMTSSSISSSVVVASKPSIRRALRTSGTRRWTSCSNGGSETTRSGRSGPCTLCQMAVASSSTVVERAVDTLKS